METYQERIAQAIDFMEQNLTNKVSLSQIAEVACYSKYHFTRVFAATTGLTVGGYLQKRRLSEAAILLMKSDDSILTVAQQFQFDSQEAFTRAFKKLFGSNPGEYRKLQHKFTPFERYELSASQAEYVEKPQIKEPEVITIAERKLVGMCMTTTLSAVEETIALWKRFMPRRMEIKHKLENGYYSMQQYDSSATYENFNDEVSFEKWAAVEVEEFGVLPEGMEQHVLKGGMYAVFIHKGPMMTFLHTLAFIYAEWLPQSGYELDHREHFEFMGDNYYGPQHPESEEEVWVPIRLKESV